MITKQDVVRMVLDGRPREPGPGGHSFAPANIALCKYWGKRDEELNLPVTPSLSVSLGALGSDVTIAPSGGGDFISLNGETLDNQSPFAARLLEFLALFRPRPDFRWRVTAGNTIPTAAGFASSASGFAAVVGALNALFGWNLDKRSLSILARLGSGSACRSIHTGFVEWHVGTREDGMDSFGDPLPNSWPSLRMGLLVISDKTKKIGSRSGMKQTVQTSSLYASWPAKVKTDMAELKAAIDTQDFERLGRTAESNALAMHATMIAAWPSIVYWLPESVRTMNEIAALRDDGLPLYFTMDAGPNIKLLFLDKDGEQVQKAFPGVRIVAPFHFSA